MREIKFRGKAECSIERLNEIGIKHDNGWVYGHLVMYGETPYIVGDFVEVDEEYTFNEFWVKVYSESVGQYAGLEDKNGKEIYDGDIINRVNSYDKKLSENYIITWSEKYLSWHAECFGTLCDVGSDIKVIGNIHDNPELLEVVWV